MRGREREEKKQERQHKADFDERFLREEKVRESFLKRFHSISYIGRYLTLSVATAPNGLMTPDFNKNTTHLFSSEQSKGVKCPPLGMDKIVPQQLSVMLKS